MKNGLPIALFLILFFSDFLVDQLRVLPGIFTFAPEAFYAFVAVIVIIKIIKNKSINIPLKYIITFLSFIYVVIAGIIINDISTFTVIAGIRTYFKFVPLFLLPFAFNYSFEDIKKQFIVLFILGLIQSPIAMYQSFFTDRDFDHITGTLNISNSLSFIMVALIIILLALYLRKQISLKMFLIFSVILFIPTTLNETKITPILLMTGFSALLFAVWRYLALKQIAAFAVLGLFFLTIFVTIYNIQIGDKTSYVKNMSSDNLMDKYNFTGYKADPRAIFNLEETVVGERRNIPEHVSRTGRVDSILIPLDVLSKNDITRLFFGFGISNVNSGGGGAKYVHIFALKSATTSLAQLIWETGILGAILFIIMLILFVRDSFALTKHHDIRWSAFSSGWFAISIIMLITTGYNNLFAFDELIILFMYFSSLIIAECSKVRNQEKAQKVVIPSTFTPINSSARK